MRIVGLINRHLPPARSVWLAWERARRRAACRAVRTGDTRQLEWLERAKDELEWLERAKDELHRAATN